MSLKLLAICNLQLRIASPFGDCCSFASKFLAAFLNYVNFGRYNWYDIGLIIFMVSESNFIFQKQNLFLFSQNCLICTNAIFPIFYIHFLYSFPISTIICEVKTIHCSSFRYSVATVISVTICITSKKTAVILCFFLFIPLEFYIKTILIT